ncbi:MAG: phage major capsid protein [Pseudomonadota bacterium]
MKVELKKLYDERLKIDADQRALVDKATTEKRGLTTDEETEYNKMDVRFNEVTGEIKKLEEVEKRQVAMKDRAEQLKQPVNDPIKPDPVTTRQDPSDSMKETRDSLAKIGIKDSKKFAKILMTQEYRDTFEKFLRGQVPKSAVMSMIGDEEFRRTLQADKDTVGGFLIAPVAFVADLIMDLHDETFMREICGSINMPKAEEIRYPVLDDTFRDPAWTSELKTGTEDASMDFEAFTFRPHPLALRVKVGQDLIDNAAISVDGIVRSELAYKLGIVEEKHFLTGNGGGQPLGVFTASANGISTGRDVSTGNTTTEIKADNLIEVVGTLKSQYRRGCNWIMHRNWITKVRKLKDGNGQYLWAAGITTDRPDSILGYPVRESEYSPNTATTGQYVACLGNFTFYKIVTAMDMRVAVLDQLYAETNEIGYILRAKIDGAPIRELAFVRSKLA